MKLAPVGIKWEESAVQGYYIPSRPLDTWKHVPGARRVGEDWAYPYNMRGIITEALSKVEPTIIWEDSVFGAAYLDNKEPYRFPLHPYQMAAVDRIRTQKAWLVAFEMGLGKTRTALYAVTNVRPKYLVVCPASVKDSWRKEMLKLKGFVSQADFYILGYEELVSRWSKHDLPFLPYINAIILDESHYIKNAHTKRGNALFEIRDAVKPKLKIALTGTPITDQPKDLFQQLDWLYPGQFGRMWDFYHRYCIVEETQYGKTIKGINPDHAEELNLRLQYATSRVTKAEVAHLLPALSYSVVTIDKPRGWTNRDFLSSLDRPDKHKAKFERFLLRTSDARIETAADIACEKIKAGKKHVLVFTYLRSTAEQIRDAINSRGATAVTVDGSQTQKVRNKIISAVETAGGVICATMHSVGTGINSLAYMDQVVFAELYYTPTLIVQALSRTHRIGNKNPVHVTFIVARGTSDEAIVDMLQTKMANVERLLASGESDAVVSAALETTKEDEAMLIKKLQTVEEAEEDEYL